MENTEGWLDTNVILRFLLNDHPQHSPRAKGLIESAERGESKLKVAPHIMCEVIYIFESLNYDREEIYNALKDFSRINGVEFMDESVQFEALLDYKDRKVDFSDALLAAMGRARHEKVWTFNQKHFARMTGL